MVEAMKNRLGHELRALATPGPRMADEVACVISVLLAIALAQYAGARMVSWAAVSALVLLKSDARETLARGVMRLIGTSAGACSDAAACRSSRPPGRRRHARHAQHPFL